MSRCLLIFEYGQETKNSFLFYLGTMETATAWTYDVYSHLHAVLTTEEILMIYLYTADDWFNFIIFPREHGSWSF